MAEETGFSSDIKKLDLSKCLKTILVRELTKDNKCLEQADIEEILKDDEKMVEDKCEDDASCVGYPTRPLYVEIGQRLTQWLLTGSSPIEKLPCYDLLNESSYMLERNEWMKTVSSKLKRMETLIPCWSQDEFLYSLREIVALLGKRGLLDLLGMRKTVGSADVWPPPRRILEETFSQKHSPETSSLLTVGARALAKHCHRDHSSSWWGASSGTEIEKNQYAFKKVSEILNGATWINIHQLPHDVMIVEARQEMGYGARWTADGQQFRGFLEPQMINGHEVGWKH